MKLTRKQINIIKIFSFLLMIGLMIVLNNKQKSAKSESGEPSSHEYILLANGSGIATNISAIPEKAEGALPLKLISNPNSNLLFLFNQSREQRMEFRYIQFQKLFLVFCSKIHDNFLIEFLATMRNKDIR
ncbi:MAG TPA: hypothetical protein PKH79_03725 [Prolixibacteraceae bacterium]|nr:hypothetical protein [Prolixibacteraceae bacterium]HPS13565.1 hypothetical protein [Prolixibacteraceae bacterium]